MEPPGEELSNLEVPHDIFANVKFFVSGEISPQISELLRNGGAERLNYFTDYVTHLICGRSPEENDITDANDVYEIPAITTTWVLMCAKLRKLISTKPYLYNLQKLFSNLVFCLSRPGIDRDNLWAIITYYGGCVQLNLDRRCTHLVTIDMTTIKFERAHVNNIPIVAPDWIIECIKVNRLIEVASFHPKRINWPKSNQSHESTTSITGFEPEKSEVCNETKVNTVDVDSTQALLDKLKQRMPWNQTEVAPPNVVAPSYLTQKNQQQGFVQQQQSPRSIVHHTAQPNQMIQQQQQNFAPNQLQLNRLIGQNVRQPIQQLRGPIHQQLLQQRMANQQRQQLLQQQLAQNQTRQLIPQQQMLIQQQQQPINQIQIHQANMNMQQQQQQQQQNPQMSPIQQPQFGNLVQLQQQQQQQQKLYAQPQAMVGQSNLAIQQQFVSQGQQQFPQQHYVQSPQQQPQQQEMIQNQQQQFTQQLLLNQQNQFGNQQQHQQPRPPLNQHIWQQQQQQQPQINIRHPVNVVQQGPRVQWSPNQQQGQQPQRQFIQLDTQTHNQLQKMPPEQQALFVARIQKHKQLLMQQKQLQQRAGGSHILIRGSVPPGLSPQQQMQWLQQQAKQQGVVLPPNIQQQTITPGTLTQPPPIQQHTPGLSPIAQQPPQTPPQFSGEQTQQQLQLRQQFRIQQLQMQREQAQKATPIQGVVRPIGTVLADSTTNQEQVTTGQPQLVVNAKTKTALANMLSIRLQSGASGGPQTETIEPSAAGTLRLMTAQHNAALNPNRAQELMALQQRRVISGPNGEVIRGPAPEPPKMAFSPRPTVPLQHRPGPFYGHNPNLKLPPDLYLLGCIFVVVEIERYLDESFPGWQQKIEKHGGEVEKQYCNRVTHVLCETQRHGVVMQALRDCKRCITIYWLSDVIKRKLVLPPWTALHLPTIYLDTTPAGKHLISICGFQGEERDRIKHMINYTGAKFTTYFSKHNTLLISVRAEGPKYVRAKKWGIPVVNVQWLTDIMLGNFTAMNQMEHIMYQQFPSAANFSFDPKLVPNLMHAWKMPINISQESYERVKRSASPVLLPKNPKKLKTEATDENDNLNHEMIEANYNYRILFSMCAEMETLKKIVKELGGVLAKSHQDCTHLVMPTLGRTNKLLFAICRGVPVLSEQWLRDSQGACRFLDQSTYTLETKEFNSLYKCDLERTLRNPNRSRVFEGRYFWITPSVCPSRKVLMELVQYGGGNVERVRRTAVQIEATNLNNPYSYIIITHENDIHLVADLLKNKKGRVMIVCSAELILSAIIRQNFEVEPFAVKVL